MTIPTDKVNEIPDAYCSRGSSPKKSRIPYVGDEIIRFLPLKLQTDRQTLGNLEHLCY